LHINNLIKKGFKFKKISYIKSRYELLMGEVVKTPEALCWLKKLSMNVEKQIKALYANAFA
jgi:hypothetical protein